MGIFAHMNMEAPNTDKELLERIKNDDPRAFEQLFNQYWQELYVLAYHRLPDEEAAKDLVQDIFVKCWERRESLEVHTSLKNYLRTALKHRIIQWSMRAELHQQAVDHLFRRMDETVYTIIDIMQADELKQTIAQVLSAFPETMQRVFALKAEQYTVGEIAQALGLAEQTVKNNSTEALKRLKVVLSEKHPDITRSFFAILLLFIKS